MARPRAVDARPGFWSYQKLEMNVRTPLLVR